MKHSTTTLAIVGATVALLSVGAITYAATNGNGPWNHGRMGNGQMHDQMNGQMGDGMPGGMNGRMGDGMNGMNGMNGQGWTVPADTTHTLDAAERTALLHMVEEEKLAHDVYVTLGGQWDVVIFDHIATAETQHEAALQTLLDRYGLDDPTAGNAVGEFTDPAFDALYDELVADGSVSQDAALQVGQRIEELDIADLQARLAETDQTDVSTVFQHLLAASQHHLQAFTNVLANDGGMMGAGSMQGGMGRMGR